MARLPKKRRDGEGQKRISASGDGGIGVGGGGGVAPALLVNLDDMTLATLDEA